MQVEAARKLFERGLQFVANLDEDRILHAFYEVMNATLRTSFYQFTEDGSPREYIAFKIDSGALPELPRPRPFREIWVYSPRFEGVHLRGGMIARGGLRWSDRREDFRTEVLGLMKAQNVKNTMIVPVGAKGGFVVKQPPRVGGREAVFAEGVRCYTQFINGLLDITDNLHKDTVVPPRDVVRRDGDDPYLVVAADKGTATFSDTANAVAAEHGHWLGDAFASGGSRGYDHKGMGITARGAWEAVKHHFRAMGHDIQKQPFTVVGIGDMAGDVFGNGMLLSRRIRLKAAFNHMHIFLDPNPDEKASYARLLDDQGATLATRAFGAAATPPADPAKPTQPTATDTATEVAAVNLVDRLITRQGISVDRHSRGETELAHRARDMESLRRRADSIAENYGVEAELIEGLPLGRMPFV